jgi:hypothetical protein
MPSMVCRPESVMAEPVVAARTAVLMARSGLGVDDEGASVADTVAPRRSMMAMPRASRRKIV